jgi:hypothetical protein
MAVQDPIGSVAAAYAAAKAGSPGPGEGNKQPNIGQSRTGHFNDGIQTAVAANGATPVGPPASIEQAPSADPMAAAKNLFPQSIQRNAAYQKAAKDAHGVRPVRRYDDNSAPSSRPMGY